MHWIDSIESINDSNSMNTTMVITNGEVLLSKLKKNRLWSRTHLGYHDCYWSSWKLEKSIYIKLQGPSYCKYYMIYSQYIYIYIYIYILAISNPKSNKLIHYQNRTYRNTKITIISHIKLYIRRLITGLLVLLFLQIHQAWHLLVLHLWTKI